MWYYGVKFWSLSFLYRERDYSMDTYEVSCSVCGWCKQLEARSPGEAQRRGNRDHNESALKREAGCTKEHVSVNNLTALEQKPAPAE